MGLLALLVSLAYHLQLPFAGVVAVETLTALLNDAIEGSLEVGTLQNVSYEKLVARDVVVRDPQGREVIRVDRLAAWPQWSALWDGAIRIERARARGGEVTLYVSGEENDSVSLVDAFAPTQPSQPGGRPPPLIDVDGIVLDEVLVHGDVPSFADLRVEDVHVEGRVRAQEDLRFIVDDGRGVMTGPYEGRTPIDRITGTFDTNMAEGLDMYARAHRGEDRIRARIELTRETPEEEPSDETELPPAEMDLHVEVDPLHFSTLDEMGVVEGLDALEGAARGHARLFGPTDDLRLRGQLDTAGGRLHARGHLPTEGALRFEAWTEDRLQLANLVPEAPAIAVGGRASIELEPVEPPGEGETVRRLHADIEPLRLGEYVVPGFTMDGVLDDDALRITALDTDVAGGEAEASGRVGFDGSLDVHASARLPEIAREPNLHRLAPDARGAVTAVVDVRADEGGENLRIDGRLSLRNARYGTVSADRLDVSGRVAPGSGPAPVVHAEGDAEGLRIGDLSLGEAHVAVDGGPGGYELSARTSDPSAGTAFELEGRARVTERAVTLQAPRLLVDVGPGDPWTGHVDLTLVPDRSVEVDPLTLSRDGERVVVDGTYRFNGPDAIDVQASNVDLAQLRPFAPEDLEGLGGRLDGQLRIRGDVDRRPQGSLQATIRDGSFRGVRDVEGTVDLTLEDTTLDTQLQLALGDRGEVAASGPIELTEAALRDPSRLLEEASLDGMRVRASSLDLGLLRLLGVADLPVDGRISTDVELSGGLALPGVRDAVVVLDQIAPEGWDPMRAKLRLSLGDGRLRILRAWVADARGELVSAQAELPLSLDDPPESGRDLWRQLQADTWSASVRVAQRRLDSYPRPLREVFPPGVSASASITAEGDEQGPHADFAAVGRYVEATGEAHCVEDMEPLVTVRGRLDGDLVEAHANGFLADPRPALEAVAYASLPLDQWVERGEVARFPSTELRATLHNADLGHVPYVCQYGRGPLSGTLTAKDLLTGDSVVGAVLDLPRLQIWESAGERGEARLSTEYRVHVRAGSSPERDALTACTILGEADVEGTGGARCREASEAAPGELISRLRVPVTWTPGELLPSYVEDARISSWTDFASVHVEPVLSFIPGVVAGDAVMDGELEIAGPWEGLSMNGQLALSEGQVQIEGLGQHLHDISGQLELEGDRITFPESHPLHAQDGGGSATVFGHVDFEGVFPRRLQLTARADGFPVRQEGMVLAWLSGRAEVTGAIEDRRTSTTIETHDFGVRLPEQTAASLQPLEPHPEVLVVGRERPTGPAMVSESYPVEVHIDAADPFWVRRNDFAALVTADLRAVYQDPDLRVRGRATIQRGTFEIFGKRFELTEGSLGFDGGSELDPEVRVIAVYEVPGRSGATVTVEVTGSLTEPHVQFRSTETNDRAEIIAMLVSGGRRDAGATEQQASEQAASFLAGLTAGILTLGLRQEFGDVIPVLAIESEGLGGTRIRAGINANDLIPDFLRGIVLDAYIEGFLTAAAQGTNAAGSTSGAGGIGGGVTVEFTFPESFLLRGTYVPVDNGSLDLFYEP